MSLKNRSRSVIDFAVARILRIFPALIVCVLITAFVVGPLVSLLAPTDYFANPGLYGYLAKTLTLSSGSASLPGVFETVPYAGYVNSSLWTLKYEVICYFGLALLGFAGLFQPRWRWPALAGLALLVATVSLSLPTNPDAFAFVDNVRYFTVLFGTGVLGYLVRKDLRINAIVLVPLFVLFVVSIRTPLAEVGAALFLGYAAALCGDADMGTVAPAMQPLRHIVRNLHRRRADPADAALADPGADATLAFAAGFRNRIADRIFVVDRHREAGPAAETDRRRAADEASTGRRAARLSCS